MTIYEIIEERFGFDVKERVRQFFSQFRNSYVGAPHRSKQLSYVYIERHGGVTNVPKYGCFVETIAVYDTYVKCRVLSSNRHYNGKEFSCAKNQLTRINLTHFCMAEFPAQDPMTKKFQEIMLNYAHSPSLMDSYLGTRQQAARARLASRFVRTDLTNVRALTWNADPYTYTGLFRKNYKEDFNKLGERHALRIKSTNNLTTTQEAIALIENFWMQRDRVTNRFRATSRKEIELIDKLVLSIQNTWNIVSTTCGHLTTTEEVHLYAYTTSTYCTSCYTNLVNNRGPLITAVDRSGEEFQVLLRDAYQWEDGSYKTYEEPPIIGSYHSNKNTFTKSLPHLTGEQPKKDVLKLGYELEFKRDTNVQHSDNVYARQMRKRILDGIGSVIGHQPYCGFERDGSVDFEMVSGYGPIDIHRAGIIALLKDNPYAGQLRSHNGGACGLHVHLDKPTSVMHAVRLQAFYNNPFNESLIFAVARRYKRYGGYSKFDPQKGDMVQAAKKYKQYKGYRYNKTECIKETIRNLTSDRYEAVNFSPEKTVEIRAFRGSLVTNTVIACLEFAYLSWYFARDTTQNQLSTDKFLEFISSSDWRHESSYLRKYLWSKGFKVWMPKKLTSTYTHTAEV